MRRLLFFLLRTVVIVVPTALYRGFLPYDYQKMTDSFIPIREKISEYAPRFYENFWNDYPETRLLFGKNMPRSELYTRINYFMLFIVDHAHNPKAFLPFISELSKRHQGYGIRGHQFAYVGETNIKTLKEMLDGSLTVEQEEAWRDAFALLTSLMKWRSNF